MPILITSRGASRAVWRWLILALLPLVLASCIKVDQTLTLAKDGSGTFAIRYGMSEQTIAQMGAMEQLSRGMAGEENEPPPPTAPFDFDEDELRAKFADIEDDGLTLVTLASETVDGWKFMRLEFKFDDLAALSRTEFLEGNDLRLTRDAAGNYVLEQQTGGEDALGAPFGDGDEGLPAELRQQMATMFAGLRIATTVVTPTEILESNATEVDGQRASWVFDIDTDPQALERLSQMDLRLVFSGRGLTMPELNKRD